jgi:sigma-B regulation protein RsbU (phosphoserine phosphatase)
MSPSAPVDPYRQALERFRSEGTQSPDLLKRLSELIGLVELASGLGPECAGAEGLEAVLRIVRAELGLERAALFVRSEDGRFALRASSALPPGAPPSLSDADAPDEPRVLGPADEVRVRHGLELLWPIGRSERPVALLGLGPLEGGRPYCAEERAFLRGVAACAATALESGRVQGELRRVNRELSARLFQLRNLFDAGRDLAGGSEEDTIRSVLVTTAMGHFLVSRCALYLPDPGGLALAEARGLPREQRLTPLPIDEARAALRDLSGPTDVGELPAGPLRQRLQEARLVLAVPLDAGSGLEGLLAIGARASGTPFSREDREFAAALARQAATALENARLNRLRAEKQRQDEELQVAREIQRSLLPRRAPELHGFDLAAESRSCYAVGGDSYDWILMGDGRLALVIADVAGKGTPASLLMASTHAYVRALAGTGAPAAVVERLNRFLFASTQTSRFVTLFYAELDAASRRLAYVNAGHVPPYRLAPDGGVSRLVEGGPALGLLERASYEAGELRLEPGDTVAMVTDGVTEANSEGEVEFGDERVCAALRALRGAGASAVLGGLLAAATAWTGPAGFADDLTALVLRAR